MLSGSGHAGRGLKCNDITNCSQCTGECDQGAFPPITSLTSDSTIADWRGISYHLSGRSKAQLLDSARSYY